MAQRGAGGYGADHPIERSFDQSLGWPRQAGFGRGMAADGSGPARTRAALPPPLSRGLARSARRARRSPQPGAPPRDLRRIAASRTRCRRRDAPAQSRRARRAYPEIRRKARRRPVTAMASSEALRSQRARRHLARGRLADRSMRGERLGPHAEHFGLGFVRIRDEPALEPGGASRHVGDRAGEQTARARFRCRNAPSARLEQYAETGREIQSRGAHCGLHRAAQPCARSVCRPRSVARRRALRALASPAALTRTLLPGRGSDTCRRLRSRTSCRRRSPARCRRSPADKRWSLRAAMPTTAAMRRRASRSRCRAHRRP